MKIFVVNCGSSSIKYQLFDMRTESVLARGLLERVGGSGTRLHHSADGRGIEKVVQAPHHTAGMKIVLEALVDPQAGVLKSIAQIDGVGHRVVHGGEEMKGSSRIDGDVLAAIRRNADLAPLHNPPNLMGIEAAMAAMPDVAHVAVFDTAFLSSLSPAAYRYAVPEEWYSRYRVRRYGFHGTSHRYVTLRAAELLGKDRAAVNLITVHLGNGCSMTAVGAGQAVDHSMGMTPLEGLVMGTRSGDLDPAILLYMLGQGLSPAQLDAALNKASGLLGLSGLSNDMRDLLAAAERGSAAARLAVDVFIYRVVKYVGAYYAVLPALDAIVLTGGIGENSQAVRAGILQGLRRLGVKPDPLRNERTVRGAAGPITADDSAVPVWVIPTNEELMIARDTRQIVQEK